MKKLFAIGLVLAACQVASAQLSADLELYLQFDETEGRVAADASGNGRDGFILNGREAGGDLRLLPGNDGMGIADSTTTWYWGPGEGKFGGAFLTSGQATATGGRSAPATIDGIDNGGSARAVAVSQFGGNLNDTGSNPPAWTMSFWTRNAYFNEGQDQVGYFQGWDNKGNFPGDATMVDGPGGYRDIYGNNDVIETDRVRTTAKFNEGRFDNRVNAGTDENVSTTDAFPSGTLADLQDGNWHNVVVIYDNNAWNNNPPVGDTMNNDEFAEVTIYVDGVEALELRNQLNGGDRVALGGMVIGSNFSWKGNGGDGQYIDDFALWNRRLDPSEVSFIAAGNMVPEPASLSLIAMGLLSLGCLRRRK